MAQLKINNDITTEKRKIVIIGKSGSGKSVLLGKLRQQYHETSIFIPSARSVHNLNTNLQEINNMENQAANYVNVRGYVHNTDTLFISKLFFKDYQEMDSSRNLGEIATKDYIKILNQILKKVSPDFHEITKDNFQLKNGGGYELTKASDGEKHTIVMICAVLSAMDNAILLIDEPEIGIHNAAIKALFDTLEEERPDCTFVYATHNLDFAKTREDADVFYISKNNANYEEPNIQKMSDDALERDILIDINGTPKPILLDILPDIIRFYLEDLNKTDTNANKILIEIIKTANDFGEHIIKALRIPLKTKLNRDCGANILTLPRLNFIIALLANVENTKNELLAT